SRMRGAQIADVVIVGGGITGCAAAHACAAAGLKTILLEAGRIGQGITARGAGLLLPDPGPTFRDIEQAHGLRAARVALDSWRRAWLDGAAVLRKWNIKCGLEPAVPLLVSKREDEKPLRREFDARTKGGVDGTWLSRRLLERLSAPESPAAIRMR